MIVLPETYTSCTLVMYFDDVDDVWETVIKRMNRYSFQVAYWHSLMPPNRFEITMGKMPKVAAERWLNKMKDIPTFKWTVLEE